MAAAIAQPTHPYFEEIDRLFYNYRLAELNRRYYTVLLERKKSWNLWTQVSIGLLSAAAAALISLALAFHQSSDLLARCAAVSSAIAFVLTVAAPVFGWNQSIDECTTRIHAWHYAERQIESALRFLRHSAQSKREADLQVQFADSAFRTADNFPDTGKQDMKLTKAIRLEVEKAIPPDYVWRALRARESTIEKTAKSANVPEKTALHIANGPTIGRFSPMSLFARSSRKRKSQKKTNRGRCTD